MSAQHACDRDVESPHHLPFDMRSRLYEDLPLGQFALSPTAFLMIGCDLGDRRFAALVPGTTAEADIDAIIDDAKEIAWRTDMQGIEEQPCVLQNRELSLCDREPTARPSSHTTRSGLDFAGTSLFGP